LNFFIEDILMTQSSHQFKKFQAFNAPTQKSNGQEFDRENRKFSAKIRFLLRRQSTLNLVVNEMKKANNSINHRLESNL
jgi:hypothetical protein